jgi:ABC-2 type transport system permease protein
VGFKALAFIRRDFQTQASYRLDFLMSIARMLMTVSLFYFISRILGSAVNPNLQRYNTDYFHFALIGIAFYPLITMSANNMSDVIHDYQSTGTLEMLFMGNTPILATLVMSMLWSYCWAIAQAFFYLVAAAVLFHADLLWRNMVLAIPIMLFAIVANTGLGFINASFVIVTKRPSPLVALLGLATSLLAGVYFPVEILPWWLQFFSRLLPATYSFAALRNAMLRGASSANVVQDLAVLAAFTLVLLPIGFVALHNAVRWAKTDGSLSQY